MTVPVMPSGGLESTHALAKFLRETDEELVVHHVRLVDPARHHPLEAIACLSIGFLLIPESHPAMRRR